MFNYTRKSYRFFRTIGFSRYRSFRLMLDDLYNRVTGR